VLCGCVHLKAERAGPRMSAAAAGIAYGAGCLLSGLAVEMHSLPLLHLGYGILGGVGWGLGYISPVSTLMRWFPDSRGLATGMCVPPRSYRCGFPCWHLRD
jgi:OFA family oxalate/formate antiporter-like MFS transporter